MSFATAGLVDGARRATRLLLLVLQVALGVLLPLADARAETGSDSTLHIESSSDGPCAPGHDPFACAFCRAQLAPYHGLERTSHVLAPAPETPGFAPQISRAPPADVTAPLHARAPPVSLEG